jgi:hypothetical protein
MRRRRGSQVGLRASRTSFGDQSTCVEKQAQVALLKSRPGAQPCELVQNGPFPPYTPVRVPQKAQLAVKAAGQVKFTGVDSVEMSLATEFPIRL